MMQPILRASFAAVVFGLMLATIYPYVYKAFVGLYSERPETMAAQLFEEFWQWRLKDSPEFATMVGFHDYDHLLESYSLQSFRDREEKVRYFLAKAKELPKSEDPWVTASLGIFVDGLEGYLRGLHTHGHLYPISFIEGIHVDIFQTIDYMVFKTVDDYKKLVSRYRKLPKQVDEIIELMKEGIKLKKTLHAVSMKNVVKRLDSFYKIPVKSEFFKFFEKFPASISEEDRNKIREDARCAIEAAVMPAFIKLKEFVEQEYMAHLRPQIAATSLPDGEAYYKECLRYHLELELSPSEVHQLGLKEVERITRAMKEVMNSLGSKDSPKEFTEKLRNDTSFLCESSEDIIETYQALISEEINPKLLTIFPSVPKSPLRIQAQDASKAGGPAAMYIQGTPDFSRPGIFYVNAGDLTRSPKYLMTALALHEGNPGHHLQGSYAMELPGMPSFRSQVEDRRYNDGPVHFPLHTAYVEGWGLYSEYLGYELGVYKTLYDKFGHLSQEMLRACRLVVDTGMHALGWSREKAVQYLLEHTSSSKSEVESEIDRYITWPGQACAYKVGELKIKELRKKMEDALGPKFDVQAFHKVVLDSPGPLTFLEKQVEKYIDEIKKA